jgi:hypothetical protein
MALVGDESLALHWCGITGHEQRPRQQQRQPGHCNPAPDHVEKLPTVAQLLPVGGQRGHRPFFDLIVYSGPRNLDRKTGSVKVVP